MYKKLRDYMLFQFDFINRAIDTGADNDELELYSRTAMTLAGRAEKMLEADAEAVLADKRDVAQARKIAEQIEESYVFLRTLEIC